MTNVAKNCTSTIIPSMRYRNAVAMIDWLVQAFGFEKKAVYINGDSLVAHAELTFGNGLIMLGSVNNGSETAAHSVQPDEIGGRETKGVNLIVSDCDTIYASAKAAGAEMVLDLRTVDYGGKAFTCRDPEGHLWSIGEYDPWTA
jgi:uncharacterized glyoxalase superfamily protein PhnB